MGGGHNGANARLFLRHGWKSNALSKHTLLEELVGKLHCQFPLADDDRSNGCFAGPGVESQAAQAVLEQARVLPQAFDQGGLLFQDLEGRQAGGGYRRRMRGGKKKGPGAVVQVLDQSAAPADVSAQSPHGLGKRPHLNIHSSVQSEMVHRAAPAGAHDPAGVGIVHHHHGAVGFRQFHDSGKRRHIAIH